MGGNDACQLQIRYVLQAKSTKCDRASVAPEFIEFDRFYKRNQRNVILEVILEASTINFAKFDRFYKRNG